METGKELGNELKSAKRKFFNVRFGSKKKDKKADKTISIFKKPGQPDKVEVKNGEVEPEPQPTPAELRAQQKAMKPMSKSFVRITPKVPKLR